METVDAGYRVGGFNSLELDTDGRPHIAYYDWAIRVLKYAHYDGSAWQLQTVDDSSANGQYCSLELDTLDQPHISYFDSDATALRYAWYDGTAWRRQTVDDTGNTGTHTSLRLDANLPAAGPARPHIAYQSDHTLRYAWHDGDTWQIVAADDTKGSGFYTSLALDTNLPSGQAQPHIIAYNWTTLELRYAVRPEDTWRVETIDQAGRLGLHTAIALEGNLSAGQGRPHISYYDQAQGNLKYAAYDGAAWQIQTVDAGGDVGAYTSLALEANPAAGPARPHISYYAHSTGDLRYAYSDGTTWYTATVDAAGDVGLHTSLALDNAGHPHISYYAARQELRYAHYDGAAWYTETVDSAGWVGEHTSLALDKLDRPHIAYYDHAKGALRYTWHDDVQWTLQTVITGNVGQYASLALADNLSDGPARPHIACYDAAHTALVYAHYDGAGWYTTTVDSTNQVGQYAALALDDIGLPHISYLDSYLGDLKYAYWDGLAWHSEVIDSSGLVGYYTALALDHAGQAHISYYQYSLGDLMYARQTCIPVTGAQIGGPQAIGVGVTGLYTGTWLPLTASPTVTLAWDNGAAGSTAVYSWTLPGTYTLTLTATNACASVTAALPVQVCQPLAEVAVQGPIGLRPGETGIYTASYAPADATPPLTATWDNGAAGLTTAYSWTVPGAHIITATVAGPCNRVQASLFIEVQPIYRIYLPLVARTGTQCSGPLPQPGPMPPRAGSA